MENWKEYFKIEKDEYDQVHISLSSFECSKCKEFDVSDCDDCDTAKPTFSEVWLDIPDVKEFAHSLLKMVEEMENENVQIR